MQTDQQQYFEVDSSSQQVPRPFWKTWKMAAALGGVLLVVLLAVLVVNLLRDRSSGGMADEDLTRLEQELQACESEGDPESCKERVRNAAARTHADVDACQGLTGAAYASCVTMAARESADANDCKGLSPEAKTSCEDLAWKASAETSLRLDDCKKIVDNELAAACTQQVTADAVATGLCKEAGVDEVKCDVGSALRAAMATGLLSECQKLSTEDAQYECEAGIMSVDDDGDGLVLADEAKAGTTDTDADSDDDGLGDGEEVRDYKSDPKNADSDGDGYNDGIEVENGYNPVG